MGFEVFKGKGRPVQGLTPTIAVQAQGRIALNQAAYEALSRPSRVELLFDAEHRRIGLRSVPDETQHAYRVTQPEPGGRWVVVALAFSRHYSIKGSRNDVYDATLEDGVLAATMAPPAAGEGETAHPRYLEEEGGGDQERP